MGRKVDKNRPLCMKKSYEFITVIESDEPDVYSFNFDNGKNIYSMSDSLRYDFVINSIFECRKLLVRIPIYTIVF